jgi:hypothetical protein
MKLPQNITHDENNPYDLTISFLDTYPKEIKAVCQREIKT